MIVQSTTCVFKCVKVCQNVKQIGVATPQRVLFGQVFEKYHPKNRGLSLVCQT
jgi:hypothetical protein